ncbi:MAG: prolipoprotein diacylglyceryl transferase [Desulfovibrionales bacterium]|nr:prolipoprotein diacylglyceryl transferase [Desulfovibrionales bacterium]
MNYFVWNADPVALILGPLQVHWYGIFFSSGLLAGLFVVRWLYSRESICLDAVDPLFIYAVVGIVLGARLGHCLFYDPGYYIANPLKIIAVWEGGLASHGGAMGALAAVWFYHLRWELPYLWILDRLAVATGVTAFCIRVGNFFNSEITGEPTHLPWAVIFKRVDTLPRHPAQLYEALAYLLIFAFMVGAYLKTDMRERAGALLGLLLTLVFVSRFAIEYVKTPQAFYSLPFPLSMGQALSLPFIIGGIFLLAARRKGA